MVAAALLLLVQVEPKNCQSDVLALTGSAVTVKTEQTNIAARSIEITLFMIKRPFLLCRKYQEKYLAKRRPMRTTRGNRNL